MTALQAMQRHSKQLLKLTQCSNSTAAHTCFYALADAALGGAATQELSSTGICRSDAAVEYEELSKWNTMANLGRTWPLGK